MYAIQTSDGKFINVQYFLGPGVFKFTVSAGAHVFRTRETAEKALADLLVHIDTQIANLTTRDAEKKATINRANARINKINATLAELVELPYKDVVARINALNKEHANLVSKIAINDSTYTREIARLNKVKNSELRVVEIISAPVAV